MTPMKPITIDAKDYYAMIIHPEFARFLGFPSGKKPSSYSICRMMKWLSKGPNVFDEIIEGWSKLTPEEIC